MTEDVEMQGFAAPHDEPIPYRRRISTYYQTLGYGAPYRWANYAEVPFTPLRKPLAESTVALPPWRTFAMPIDQCVGFDDSECCAPIEEWP